MKKRKILKISLLALAAGFVVGLALWRLLPRSLADVMGQAPGAVTSMAAQVTVTGVADGKSVSEAFTLDALPPESGHFATILEILEGTGYRPDFRSLLPWPRTRSGADSRFDGRSVSVLLLWGDGREDACTLYFQTESQVTVSLGTEEGFRVYHPTDRTVQDALADYLIAHGEAAE